MEKEAFYCKALQGLSSYNICINSDMTVSCNCQDYEGKGQIGDLKKQTFKEVFSGPIAQGFRKSLAEGKFPLAVCGSCVELKKIDGEDPAYYPSNYRLPTFGIMVENTVSCNLKCLSCHRERLLQTRKQLRMSLDDLKVVADIIHDCQIKTVFYFNLGEPFLSKTIFEEISILKNRNPNLVVWTSTNGLLINDETNIKAALLMDIVIFSIDGATQHVVDKYQIGGDFKKSYENMRNLVWRRYQAGAKTPLIEWKYVVFSWNDNAVEVERAIALAKKAHVDIISFWSGGGPESFISQKFIHDPYFLQLGNKSWKGREICFPPYGKMHYLYHKYIYEPLRDGKMHNLYRKYIYVPLHQLKMYIIRVNNNSL
jgi:uncharacterized Fe-S cluster-containing radical SAM superfamily protein